MRVTSQSTWNTLRNDMNGAARRHAAAIEQASSERRIQKFSDAPTEAATVLRLDEQTGALDAYAKQAQDADAWLATGDTALQTVSARINEAMGTVRASNGTMDATSRDALATQLEAISSHLFEVASTVHLGRPVFGGFGDTAVSRDAAGTVTYTGDSGQVLRQVAPTVTLPVNVDGAAAFGFASGDDVFKVLKDAAAAIRSGDMTASTAALGRLEARQTDALTALQGVGAIQNRVDSASDSGDAMKLSLAAARSSLVDVDVPKAVMDMQLAQDGYTAVMSAVARTANLATLTQMLH